MFTILLNGLGICIGTLLGCVFKNHSSEKVSRLIISVIGLQLLVMGIKDAVKYENPMTNIVYLVVGTVIGEILDIDGNLKSFGKAIQKKFGGKNTGNNIVQGFVTATLIFCIGSMAILGSVKIALENDSTIIYVKTILDTVMAGILASTYGIGVIFSAGAVIVYQGLIFLLGNFLTTVADPQILNQISTIGGVLLVGLAFTLLFDNKNIKATNMLPAMFLPVIVAVIKNII